MTSCARCPKPGEVVGHFQDGSMELLCPEHYDQHLARAFAEKEEREAERIFRGAREEYLRAAAHFSSASERFDRARRAARNLR